MPNCSRCGMETASGPYCDNCSFYMLNDQCWRCRMYLPKVELQQWKGQTYCPYCIQDLRHAEKDAQQRRDEGAAKAPEGIPPDSTPPGQGQVNPDYLCDKCRDEMDIAYVVADHKFCEMCFQQQLRDWKEERISAPPYMKFRVKDSPGMFMRFIRFIKRKISDEWERRNRKKREKKD